MWKIGIYVVRRPLVEVSSLLPLCGFGRLNLGSQAQWQTLRILATLQAPTYVIKRLNRFLIWRLEIQAVQHTACEDLVAGRHNTSKAETMS